MWIITRDSDYGTLYKGKRFLNQFLYEELRKVCPDAEAFLFDDVGSGIRHFAGITGVKADNLPSPKETEENKKELEALPPLDLMPTGHDAVMETILFRNGFRAVAGTAIGGTSFTLPSGIAPAIANAVARDLGSAPPVDDATEPPDVA